MDQEVWSSSGSSPIQQPSRSSHQSPLQLRKSLEPNANASSPTQSRSGEVLSLQQFLDEGIDPTEVNAGGPSCLFRLSVSRTAH